MPDEKLQRVKWADFVRALAILSVVLCHSAERTYTFSSAGFLPMPLASKAFAIFCYIWGRTCLLHFVMLSGYLLLDRVYDVDGILRFWKKRWLHLLICTWIWFMIYDASLLLGHKTSLTPLQFIGDLLFLHTVKMSHVWYLPMILGIYVLIPFVAYVLRKFDTRLFAFPMILFTFYAHAVPVLSVVLFMIDPGTQVSNSFSLGFSGGVYGLYLVYGYMVKKGVFKKIPSAVVAFVFLLFFGLTIWLQIAAYKKGLEYNVWYDNILLLVASLALFELFSRIRYVPCYPVVKAIAKYSFSIYLIHIIVRGFALPYVKALELAPSLKIFLLSVICFGVSYAAAWLISKIPRFGNYILYINTPGQKQLNQ